MLSFAVLALASIATSATALVIPRSPIPPTYDTVLLENYHTYNTRYMALDCKHKHNTTFFQDCCHPMLATENLKDNRKPYCTPSASASSSAAHAEPTSTDVPSGDDDCDDNESSSAADPAPTSADAPNNVALPSAPSPSSSKPQPTASTDSPKPSPSPSSSNSGGNVGGLAGVVGKLFGDAGSIATFFFQNGNPGNCGQVHSDSDKVVALPSAIYDNGAHCGKTVVIENVNTGKTATGVVADSCPTCPDSNSLDLSKGLYDELAAEEDGEFPLKWGYTS